MSGAKGARTDAHPIDVRWQQHRPGGPDVALGGGASTQASMQASHGIASFGGLKCRDFIGVGAIAHGLRAQEGLGH